MDDREVGAGSFDSLPVTQGCDVDSISGNAPAGSGARVRGNNVDLASLQGLWILRRGTVDGDGAAAIDEARGGAPPSPAGEAAYQPGDDPVGANPATTPPSTKRSG